MELIITTPDEVRKIVKQAIIEREKELTFISNPKLYTINQLAKKLNKAHATISKLVKSGIIKSTADGLITETAVNDYLNNE